MKKFLIRWAVNGLGLWLAGELIDGISFNGDWRVIAVAALIFSIVNAFVRPILIILSLPAIIVTLGLFTLIVNSLMLYLVELLYPAFSIATFGAAILAVVIIWVVNFAANTLIKE